MNFYWDAWLKKKSKKSQRTLKTSNWWIWMFQEVLFHLVGSTQKDKKTKSQIESSGSSEFSSDPFSRKEIWENERKGNLSQTPWCKILIYIDKYDRLDCLDMMLLLKANMPKWKWAKRLMTMLIFLFCFALQIWKWIA